MSHQLYLGFEAYHQPNDAGVFADCEVIEMPPLKNRCTAEVCIAFTPAGYCWGSAAMLEIEGYGGMPNQCDIPAGRVVATREAAIAKACEDVLSHVEKKETPAARAITAWAKQLRGAA
ncbi:MAG: hypothetical protein V4718_04355 [Pseudomonadota bacterium]